MSQGDAAAGTQHALPPTWVFPVRAGRQLFELNVRRFDTTSRSIEAQFSQITALYSPFGATGEPFPDLSG